MTDGTHEHVWREVNRDENANRTRTGDTCVCGAYRHGCLAKRLDEEGRTAWGPVGKQWYSIKEGGAP